MPAFLPTPTQRALRRSLADMDKLIAEAVEERRREARPEQSDLLSELIEAVDGEGDGGGMSRRQLRDELVTLLLAGHETTSHALTWTFHLLAQHPEVEARAREEARTVLGESDVAARAVDRLHYTEQVLSEAMRLYPPAYVLARQAREDTEVAGYAVPKDTDVVMWIYHVQRDPRWFPDPLRFDPERFSPSKRGALTAFSYLPFGAGSRTCIGKHFAMIEAKLVLACTLRRVSFAARGAAQIPRDMAVTLAPRGGVPMRVRDVAGWAKGL